MKIEMISRENRKPEMMEVMLLAGKLVVPAANIRAVIESATATSRVIVGVVLSWLFCILCRVELIAISSRKLL